jgi:L-tyrosine isonitrile synthase
MSNESALCACYPESIAFEQEYGIGDAAVSCAYHPSRHADAPSKPAGRSIKAGPHRSSAKKRVSAEAVLRSFNTWAFKREQPTDLQLMLRLISDSIALGEPVSFVLYWGKGPRSALDAPDVACLDYLRALASRIREVYEPGATVKLIFTDTHAELNGYAPPDTGRYFGEVDACARERGFETCLLGQLTRSPALAARPANDDIVPDEMLERLSASAKKWYRGDGTAGQGALRYFQMNMIEKRAVEVSFPRSIFVTFNGSELRSLFPDFLPIFYMYSLRRGVSIKPWFLPAAAARNPESVELP